MNTVEDDPYSRPRLISNCMEVNKIYMSTGQDLEMEDEGELFNNKYLTDLKEGRCVMGAPDDSRFSRVSELVWRNSLCPPHLKSSYPAELQFASPTRYKEDDIKVSLDYLYLAQVELHPALIDSE